MPAKQKILIVDDDTNIAELISLYLTKEFYQVQIVDDGEQALQVFDILSAKSGPAGSDASRHGRLSGVPGTAKTFQRTDHHALCQRRSI